jgi:predicted adenylyl cyclase CyaB
MAKFEIELRGTLEPEQKDALEKFLSKNGKLVKEYKRTQWCFGLSHEKKIDLRIKDTDGECIFSLKVGKLGNRNRKELSIPFPKEKFNQAFEFLKFLGHREGVKAIRNAKVYEYKDIEWAIVEVPNHSFYFEAEKLAENKGDGKKAEEDIKKVASELNLKLATPKETVEYIKILDKESNKIFRL